MAQLQPHSRVTRNMANVSPFHPVLGNEPELRSDTLNPVAGQPEAFAHAVTKPRGFVA